VSSINRLYRWVWGSLDWLFPPVCGGCNQAGFRWCPDCQKKVKIVPDPVCRTCGLPISYLGQCANCKEFPPPYRMMRSWLVFEGPIRHALHQMKYHRNLALGEALAQPFAIYFSQLDWEVDLVVPVPLGKERLKKRGYNQVGLVAVPLAASQRRRYAPEALIRTRETRSQVGLTHAERSMNVLGAFKAEITLVSGKNILLVDDVATTGATMSASATALLEAGASSIFALTLARAISQHGLNPY
jgi:competence protein ComFC